MKTFLFSITFLLTSTCFAQTMNYPGNGKNGFGGAIGLGTISITEAADSVKFRLNRGAGLFDSLVVFYIDEPTTTSGISSTANISYSGTVDKYSVAASGRFSATQQSVLNFPATFKPDMAVVFDKNGGKIFFLVNFLGTAIMQEQGIFQVTPSGSNNSPVYTATTAKTQFGLTPTDSLNFNFMGNYIGQTASRSNEAVGDPFTGYLRVDGYNPYTVQSFFRFSSALAVLPVTLVNFSASNDQGKVQLKWTVAQEINIDEYQIQRSANGRDFSAISLIKAQNAPGSTSYTSLDLAPLKGNNYYRLKVIERGGIQFSKVILIRNGNVKNSFTVKQLGSTLNVNIQEVEAGSYRLMLINSNGQTIQTTTILHDGINATRSIGLMNIPAKGIYRVVLQSSKNNLVQSLIIQ